MVFKHATLEHKCEQSITISAGEYVDFIWKMNSQYADHSIKRIECMPKGTCSHGHADKDEPEQKDGEEVPLALQIQLSNVIYKMMTHKSSKQPTLLKEKKALQKK